MSVCNLCQEGRASSCPLANRESEQNAPRDALLFESWQCNTYTAICKIKRFALSGLVHPHSDACVQTVLPRSCIYVSLWLYMLTCECTQTVAMKYMQYSQKQVPTVLIHTVLYMILLYRVL